LASFIVRELIVKKKKAHNIGEELILPACKETDEVIIGSEATEEISKVPLSNDTVHRRLTKISTDTENNDLGKLQANKKFSFQLVESTDVSGKAQIISLFFRQLETRTTGADIFAAVNTYFQEKKVFFGLIVFRFALMAQQL
jgi:hypothetical protein